MGRRGQFRPARDGPRVQIVMPAPMYGQPAYAHALDKAADILSPRAIAGHGRAGVFGPTMRIATQNGGSGR